MRLHRLWICAALIGCGPTLEELNEVVAVADQRVDDTAPDAPFAPGQYRSVADADATFSRADTYEKLYGVAMPGDLDGDGLGDLVAWTMRYVEGDPRCERECLGLAQLVVYIDYGGPTVGVDGVLEPEASIESWRAVEPELWVAPGGDLDGDGRSDLLLSVAAACGQGNVFTIYGGERLSGVLRADDLSAPIGESGECTGFGSATGVGDIDADGFDDFVIAARETGRAYLYYGRAARAQAARNEGDADAVLVLAGEQKIDLARRAGDVDGDGREDLLVASARPLEGETKPWFLVRGGARLSGEVDVSAMSTRFDAADVRALGDLDGDGAAELGVTLHGAALDGYVVRGREQWPAEIGASDGVLHIERGPGSEGGIQTTLLAAAGDIDGNDAPDLLYVDSHASADEEQRGQAHVFLGPHALEQASLPLESSAALIGQLWREARGVNGHAPVDRGADSLGQSWDARNEGIAAGSDLDGDGYDDFAILAGNAPNYGLLYVWRGR